MVGFGIDELPETMKRENFIGVVTASNYPCGCGSCSRGNESLVQRGGQSRDNLHMVIKPLSGEYDLDQHIYLDPSAKTKWSKWGAFGLALKKAGLDMGSESEFIDKAFEFAFVDDFTGCVALYLNKPVPTNVSRLMKDKRTDCWIVVREVRGDELNKYLEMNKSEEGERLENGRL